MRYLFAVLLFLNVGCDAQQKPIKKIATECSEADLKASLYHLASKEMKGRLMGSHEDTLASLFIIDRFKKEGIAGAYDGGRSYLQAITVQRQYDNASLTIGTKVRQQLDGWELFPFKPISLKNAGVVVTDHTDAAAFMKDILAMNVSGKAVVIDLGLFQRNTEQAVNALMKKLKAADAKVLVFGSPGIIDRVEEQKSTAYLPKYKLPFYFEPEEQILPNLYLTPERFDELLSTGLTNTTPGKHYADLKSGIDLSVDITYKPEQAPNVIGVLKGTDSKLPAIILSAHHDHDGPKGDEINYGAVDNASGVAAIMQIATMLNKAAKQGLRPKRTIIFASFTGEERGLLGAQWYADHPLLPLSKTHAILNIDQLGRTDTLHGNKSKDSVNYAYILVKDSVKRGLRNALYKANEVIPKLVLDKYYEDPRYERRRLLGSDQYPFHIKGVPFIRIDCGFSRDYHQVTDTPDKINYPLLKRQTQLAFLTLWNLAN
ncbi:M28 family metallopeptidase [Mucilaginibacter myungsuensis]|uniref:M28 family peptidase n=1 Tax=Mucilaginibacter myungsuensis TaxID=649104 RepID=A0A929PWZ4_9SPHI|nr:M28 family peptidase [Mucilaginibacter myungsuensis]MBE9662616.1 M28 family peptidase [Mucilaginibacter myungsuensis]MDN3598036.1 M28 family peptidase [Mucilaginibacter myungsuensis]